MLHGQRSIRWQPFGSNQTIAQNSCQIWWHQHLEQQLLCQFAVFSLKTLTGNQHSISLVSFKDNIRYTSIETVLFRFELHFIVIWIHILITILLLLLLQQFTLQHLQLRISFQSVNFYLEFWNVAIFSILDIRIWLHPIVCRILAENWLLWIMSHSIFAFQ